MAKVSTKKCRQCKREGTKLFLKSDRCYGPKCPIEKKGAVPPGVHGHKRTRRPSDYGIQLREKQKIKRIYGITEKQMKRIFLESKKEAQKDKKRQIVTGDRLMSLLELRLDNALFRSGLVSSRSIARQLVSHRNILVNGKIVNIPSYKIKVNQVMSLSTTAMAVPVVKTSLEKKNKPAKWITRKGPSAKIISMPERQDLDADISEQLVIEFYSR